MCKRNIKIAQTKESYTGNYKDELYPLHMDSIWDCAGTYMHLEESRLQSVGNSKMKVSDEQLPQKRIKNEVSN